MARISEIHFANVLASDTGIAEFVEIALTPAEFAARGDFAVAFYDVVATGDPAATVGRVVTLDDPGVSEKILRRLKLWPEQPAPACMPGRSLSAKAGLSRAPASMPPPDAGERIVKLCFDDPFRDYPVTTLSRGTGLTWRH